MYILKLQIKTRYEQIHKILNALIFAYLIYLGRNILE